VSPDTSSGAAPGFTDPYSEAAAEIGFTVGERYNASALLFDNLDRARGPHLAVTGPSGSRTYAELCSDAARYGLTLLDLGLTRGDRVLMFLDDTPAYPAAFFGALRAGLVPVLINTLTPADLLNFYLQDSAAKVAITDVSFADRFDDRACLGSELRCIIFTNGKAPVVSSVRAMSEADVLDRRSDDLPAADTHRDDMAFWQYSSGSTGRPKGIVHLQHDMAYTAVSFARHILQIRPDDICLSVPKIFFAYGLGNSLTFPFSVGATAVLLPGQPKPGPIFEAISLYRPTLFFGLPTLYTALIKTAEARLADFSSLRMCLSAAEVLSDEVAEQWRKMAGLAIVEGLGSTEVLHIYLSNTATDRKPGAAGRPVPGYQIKLVDRNGKQAGDGEEGILWVRGDSSAPCYWDRPDKTSETMRPDGWIYTGDRMMRDADGYYFFLGRADDLIKVSGQWVYPLEVERCLAGHPLVRECAVMAIQLPDRRMTLKAFVVLNHGGSEEEAVTRTLQSYVKQTLLPYKYPRIVEFRDELPKTGTGKIDRQMLLRNRFETTA
jgi:benzoate-CoA ligase family protein